MTDINIQLFHYIYTINTYSLPSGHVQLWALDCKEGRMPMNWYLQTVVLEKTPESPLDSKEIKPVNLEGDQPWIFTERTDTEVKAQAPIVWSPDANRQLVGKVRDAGKDWGQQEKRISEDEMAGQHHRCNGHGQLGQTLGDSEGQGSLGCWSPRGAQRVGYDWVTEQQKQWIFI